MMVSLSFLNQHKNRYITDNRRKHATLKGLVSIRKSQLALHCTIKAHRNRYIDIGKVIFKKAIDQTFIIESVSEVTGMQICKMLEKRTPTQTYNFEENTR